jgi:hypothetical protein
MNNISQVKTVNGRAISSSMIAAILLIFAVACLAMTSCKLLVCPSKPEKVVILKVVERTSDDMKYAVPYRYTVKRIESSTTDIMIDNRSFQEGDTILTSFFR